MNTIVISSETQVPSPIRARSSPVADRGVPTSVPGSEVKPVRNVARRRDQLSKVPESGNEAAPAVDFRTLINTAPGVAVVPPSRLSSQANQMFEGSPEFRSKRSERTQFMNSEIRHSELRSQGQQLSKTAPSEGKSASKIESGPAQKAQQGISFVRGANASATRGDDRNQADVFSAPEHGSPTPPSRLAGRFESVASKGVESDQSFQRDSSNHPQVRSSMFSGTSPSTPVMSKLNPARGIASFLVRAVHESSLASLSSANGAALGSAKTAKAFVIRAAQPDHSGGEAADGADGPKEAPEFREMLAALRLRTTARQSSARLQLDPPELGRLQVDVRLRGEQLFIDIVAESKEALEQLGERADGLRAALSRSGMEVARLQVSQGLGNDSWASRPARGNTQRSGASSPKPVMRSRALGDEGLMGRVGRLPSQRRLDFLA